MGPTQLFFCLAWFPNVVFITQTQKFWVRVMKMKTPNWCFQKLKTEFQWHNGKYCDFMGPVCSEWSNQFPEPLILLLERFLFSSFFFSFFSRPSLHLPLISSTLHSKWHLRWWTNVVKTPKMNTLWLKTNNRGMAESSPLWIGLYHRQFFTPCWAEQFLSPSLLPFARSVHLSP